MEPLKQNYSFDAIVLKVNIQESPVGEDGQEVDRTYSIRLYDDFIDIPPDRLLTNHFSSKPLAEFVSSPCDLIGSLSNRGICVSVYDNDEIVGTGTAKFSNALLRMLTDQTFKTNEQLTVELKKGKKSVGTMELNIKISSADPDLDTRLKQFGCYDICRPLDKSTNPRDIIFTLGRSGRCAATTCITDQRLMVRAGAPFSCMHAKASQSAPECGCFIKGVKPPTDLDQSKERERKLLKKLLVDLDIDREHIPTPPSGYGMSRSPKCKCLKAKDNDSSSFSPMDMWSDDELSEDENGDDAEEVGDGEIEGEEDTVELLPHQLKELEQCRKRALGVCPPLAAPALMSTKYKPPTLCPLCNANITWLPKIAACPYCGYKRLDLEQPSEEPFDETTTAAEVLRNHFIQTRMLNDQDSKQKLSSCAIGDGSDQVPTKTIPKECTCNSGRVCTRCRIRELCEQLFKMNGKTKVPTSLQVSPQPSVKALKKKTSTASQRRGQLLNIFTEMRDNYSSKKPCSDLETNATEKQRKSRGNRGGKGNDAGKQRKFKTRKAKRRSRSKRYTFLVRKEPVRQRSTHLCCTKDSGRVPCHMGWMWTASDLARHKCWKPGAIAKPIRELMAYFLHDYPVDTTSTSRRHCGRRGKGKGKDKDKSVAEQEKLVQHPTLHIKKKHDEYTITLRPLKDAQTLQRAANPYANMKPVVFRIVKDPIESGKREMKISLKESGFPACTCNQPIAHCFCRSHVDKIIVEHEVKKLSEERSWNDISESFVFNDLSESDSENELDFGVTPPAGVIKPERLNQPDKVNTETQYDENDWAMPTMFPHPPNALIQYGGCVVGERRGRFPWIMGKGYVHQEPKPAPKINKPPNTKKSSKKVRQKGGYDDIKRNWHKSNQMSDTIITYDNGPIR